VCWLVACDTDSVPEVVGEVSILQIAGLGSSVARERGKERGCGFGLVVVDTLLTLEAKITSFPLLGRVLTQVWYVLRTFARRSE
jgi:hypothetical protein